MGLIRSLLSLAFLGAFLLLGFTVPLGERTLFGHVANIWSSDQAQELVESVKDESGPLVDRVKRGVKAGLADESALATDAEAGGDKGDSSVATTEPTPEADDKQQ